MRPVTFYNLENAKPILTGPRHYLPMYLIWDAVEFLENNIFVLLLLSTLRNYNYTALQLWYLYTNLFAIFCLQKIVRKFEQNFTTGGLVEKILKIFSMGGLDWLDEEFLAIRNTYLFIQTAFVGRLKSCKFSPELYPVYSFTLLLFACKTWFFLLKGRYLSNLSKETLLLDLVTFLLNNEQPTPLSFVIWKRDSNDDHCVNIILDLMIWTVD